MKRTSKAVPASIIIMLLSLLLAGFISPTWAFGEPATSDEPDLLIEDGPYWDQYEMTRWYESTQPDYDTNVPYPDGLLTPDSTALEWDLSSPGSAIRSFKKNREVSEIPPSYDSRDHNVISSVKDQGGEGCCWAFALCEAAQASYLTNVAGAGSLPMVDLSEWQIAYFEYSRPVDDLALTVDDFVSVGGTPGMPYYYSIGGNPLMSSIGAANGIGFAYEDVADYDVMEAQLTSLGSARLNDEACYPADSYLVENTYIVDPVGQPSVMKRLIMAKGAGTLFFDSNSDLYDFEHNSYYNPGDNGTGHIIAVIGWDDTYPKENFLTPAEHDGAWLCKNSWSEEWGDGGYFWMSYDEPSIEGRDSIFLDISDNTSFDHTYYYDGTVSIEMVDGYEYEANVFTAQQDETVRALSFYTVGTDTRYEVSVYLNGTPGDPMSGECVLEGISGSVEIPGYHMVHLDEGQCFDIDAGETFAIVVHETHEGEATRFFIDRTVDYGWISDTSSSEVGQSFASADGESWDDLSATDGNLRIKAFTTVRPAGEVASLAFSQDSYEVALGTIQRLDVLSGDRVVNNEQLLTFVSSNCDVLRMDARGNVYPVSTGEVTVTVSCGDLEASVKVTVTPANVTAIEKPEGYATEENPLEVTVNENASFQLNYTLVNGRGLTPYYGIEDLNSDAGSYNYQGIEPLGNGMFKARREGLYRINVAYDNDTGEMVKQQFYIHATIDTTEFEDAADLRYVDYDNMQTKVFVYAGERNADGYVFRFDDECSLESNYDYLYVIEDDEPFTAQDALDNAMYRSWDLDRRISLTGQQLAGLDLTVPYEYVAFVFVSDQATTDYGFSTTAIDRRIPADGLVFDDDIYDEDYGDEVIELAPGDVVPVPSFHLVADESYGTDPTDTVTYRLYDYNIVTIDEDGMIHANGIGETWVDLHVDAGNGIQGAYLDGFKVIVTTDEDPVVQFAEDGPIELGRGSNQSHRLELVESPWVNGVSFTSSNPVVAYVDSDGIVTPYSVGTTTIGAWFDGVQYDSIQVNVVATSLSSDFLSVDEYVSGMHEEYVYSFPGAELTGLTLSRLELADGETLTIYDGDGDIVLGPLTGSLSEAQSVMAESDTLTILLDTTGSVTEDEPAGTRRWGGFMVTNIASGIKPTGIAPIDDQVMALEKNGNYYFGMIQIPVDVEPAGALKHLTCTVTLESESEFLYAPSTVSGYSDLSLRAYGEGEATITLSDDFGHSTSFHLTATADGSSSTGKPVTSLEVLDGQGGQAPDAITLTVGETLSLPIVFEPADTTEHVGAVSSNTRIVSAFTYGTGDGTALFLQGRTAGTTKVRVKTESNVWRTLTVTVQDAPEPPHEHSYVAVVTEPTCTEQGFTTYTCACGDSYVDDYTDPLGHAFGAWTSDGAETHSRSCSRCDAVETENHQLTGEVLVTPATFEADGIKRQECTVCGATKDTTFHKIDVAAIDQIDYDYTGSPIEAEVVAFAGDKQLAEGVDFTVTYSDNIEIGPAFAHVTFQGDYSGECSLEFRIVPILISDAQIAPIADQIYNGDPITPEVMVSLGSTTLKKDTDYTLSFENNIEVGTATVTVTGTGIYEGTVTATFEIIAPTPGKIDITGATVELEYTSATYAGSALEPAVIVTFDGTELIAGTDYTVAYSGNDGVGTAVVTVTGMGDYEGSATATFEILAPQKIDISNATIAPIPDQEYTGSAIMPAVTVTLDGSTLTAGTDYTVEYSGNVNVGTATVTVKGTGAYEGAIEATFNIIEKPSGPFFLDADPADTTNHGAEVDWMGRSGISMGWEVAGGREYRGLEQVTRCDFAAFLYRMADLADDGARNDSIKLSDEKVESVLEGVKDCTPKTDHAPEIAWLIDSGISRGWGNPDGTVSFRPYAKVARQDMAAFLYRFADLQDDKMQNQSPEPGPEQVAFSDVRHGDEANHAAEVEWLASVGVTKGWDMHDGTYQFRGTNIVARQDMAAFMYRLYTYLRPQG